MKKINGANLCYALSILLFLGFAVYTAIDYCRYDSTLNSAPFSAWVIVNGIVFLLPAMAALFVGMFLRNKGKKD